MSINIQRVQAEVLAENFDLGGSEDRASFGPVQLTIIEKLLSEYGIAFQKELEEQIKSKEITASGKLRDGIRVEVSEDKLTIRMLDYYDYPNKGVKGVDSSRNAPGSPYQYKNYGMNARGRDSIRKYIQSGKAKVASVRNDAARGIGSERKGVDLETTKVNTLIYLIKKYGVKKTSYYDIAFKKVFGTLQQALADGIGYQITLTINSINRIKKK